MPKHKTPAGEAAGENTQVGRAGSHADGVRTVWERCRPGPGLRGTHCHKCHVHLPPRGPSPNAILLPQGGWWEAAWKMSSSASCLAGLGCKCPPAYPPPPRVGGINTSTTATRSLQFRLPGGAAETCALHAGADLWIVSRALTTAGEKPRHAVWPSRCQRDSSQALLAPPWPQALLPQPIQELGICHATRATGIFGQPGQCGQL